MTLVTEKEAAEKWCPMARVVPGIRRGTTMVIPPGMPSAHNRVQEAGYESDEPTWHAAMSCIGSRCMAWRWKEQPGPQPPDAPERDDRGWCGAFGKVEP